MQNYQLPTLVHKARVFENDHERLCSEITVLDVATGRCSR